MTDALIYFMVTWCLYVPQTKTVDVVDEFERYKYSYSDVTYVKDCEHSKTFECIDSAMAFYQRGLNQPGVIDIKIDKVDLLEYYRGMKYLAVDSLYIGNRDTIVIGNNKPYYINLKLSQ